MTKLVYLIARLITKSDLSLSKHSGVKALFNKHFVKTGHVSRKNGKIYNQLFEDRQEGDYIDFVLFDRESVEPWVPQAEQFIESISLLAVKQDNA